VLELDPHYYLAHQYLGFACFQKGEIEEGIQACEMAAQAIGPGPWALAFRAIASAHSGKIDEVNLYLHELRKLSQSSYISPTIFSWIYSCIGEIDQALECIEKAIDERDGLISHLHSFPLFDHLHTHPRYHALLRKMNLEP
jgi:tetratricopeptide (TPR) repeat protein